MIYRYKEINSFEKEIKEYAGKKYDAY